MSNVFPLPSSTTAQNSSTATTAGTTVLSSNAAQWALTKRHLSRATLEALGVGSGTTFFPELEAKSEALFFKYRDGWKARSFPAKGFVAGKGFKLDFWNIERVLKADPARVFCCEGELDALALVEAGISPDCVLSVPNGARERAAENPQELRGYDYVDEALKAGLSRMREFIFVGDADAPGRVLRQDLVRLIGPARFRFLEWPEGIHDANEMLVKDGAEALFSLVDEGTLPWPVKGVYLFNELPETPPLEVWSPGFPEWESKLRLAAGTLSIVTGQPNAGKTLLFNQIWFQIIRDYKVRLATASFETRPKPHMRRQIRSLHSGKLEKDMTEAEKAEADAWIQERYVFFVHPERQPSLSWFFDCAEVAVIRHGCSIVTLDPWSWLEDDRAKGESETDNIKRCLREAYRFASDMNCHVQIVAHPAKLDDRGRPPTLEDISGSKHWENMADQGFVVHRPKMFDGMERKTECELYHRKSRFEELGYPCKLNLRYDLKTAKYVSTDYEL